MSSAIRNSVKTIILTLLLGLGGFLQAQGIALPKIIQPSEVDTIELPIELFDVSDGLSQGYIGMLAQDKLGYLWIPTRDGLNRFDGYEFKTYRHDPKDSLSIASNCSAPILDPYGRLLLTVTEATIDLFDPKTETFHHFPDLPTHGKGFRSREFGFPMELSDGSIIKRMGADHWDILIPTRGGDHFDINQFEIKPLEEHFPQLKRVLDPKSIDGDLWVSPTSDLWFWREDSVFKFAHSQLQTGGNAAVFLNPTQSALRRQGARFCRLQPFFNPQGQALLFIADTLLQLDEGTHQFVPRLVLPPPYDCYQSYFFHSDGRLWLVFDRGRFLRIDLHNQRVQAIRLRGTPEALTAAIDGSFGFEDRANNLWIKTSGYGLLKISSRSELFKSLPTKLPKYDRNYYTLRVLTPKGKAIYDADVRRRWMELSANLVLPEIGFLTPAQLAPLTMDGNGHFWMVAVKPSLMVGDQWCYLVRIDSATGKLDVMDKLVEHTDGGMQSFLFPDRANHLWMLVVKPQQQKTEFQCYDIATGTKKRFPIPGLSGKFPSLVILDWYQSPSGVIWMATSMGLHSIDPKTGVTASYRHLPNELHSLSEDIFYCVEADPRAPDRILWAGTNGGGLNCLDRQTGKFHQITTAHGLPNDVVYAILVDKHNNLWLSTNNGICLFDPLRMTFRNFGKADGLLGNEFNHYEHSMSATGEIYFGGISGVNYFDPEDFYTTEDPSNIVIHSLKLDNKPVVFKHHRDPNATGFQLDAPMESTRELVFAHDHSMIGIGFALLDLTVPSRNKFRYRLRGYNEEWIEAGTSHEAIYTNLNPGSYTFEVMGCNSRNVWTTTPATLTIVIRPPWWGTWWFRIGVILLISGMIFALYSYRLQQVLKVERLRNRIGQDLHDEIGSTLSSISLYSAVMQRTSDQLPPNTINILDKIIGSTSQMMESMNDMVWTIKASNDSFEQVINRMRAFAVNMTEAQEINMTFDVDPQVEKLSLGMEQRKNVYLIYKEAVNNAAKYARCTELKIELKKLPGILQLTITDNGIGFDPEDKSAREHLLGGNGLAGMRARGKAIGAEVEIESAFGKGAVVRVRVRL